MKRHIVHVNGLFGYVNGFVGSMSIVGMMMMIGCDQMKHVTHRLNKCSSIEYQDTLRLDLHCHCSNHVSKQGKQKGIMYLEK